MKRKICIAGKNDIAVNSLQYVLNFFKKKEVCVILNTSDDFVDGWQKSLGLFAVKNNIDIVNIEDVCNIDDLIFVSLEYDKIINPLIFNSSRLFNIHFSYLPEYKGVYTSIFPILHGRSYSGVTLHCIDQGIDTGDIIDQVKFSISGMTSFDLYRKYSEVGEKILVKNFQDLFRNKFAKIKQEREYSTYYSRKSIDVSDVNIKFNQTAFQVKNFVNALNFRPYQLPYCYMHKINRVKMTNIRSYKKFGEVIFENKEFYQISTLDYDVILFKDYFDDLKFFCENNDVDSLKKILQYTLNDYSTDKYGLSSIDYVKKYELLDGIIY
jgi:methionyl-tRNA formyltransferase